MIKYAKTKDNKIVRVDVENGIYTSKYELVGEPKNTIKELYDLFVLVDPKDFSCIHVETDYNELIRYKHCLWNNKGNIYGAIWTNKGLIYITKMKGILPNGEIDWELL